MPMSLPLDGIRFGEKSIASGQTTFVRVMPNGSVTVTVKVLVAVLPAASFAVMVTVVVPRPNVLPETGEVVTVGALTASVAVGANVTTAPAALVASTMRLDCAAMIGAVVSRTVILKMPVAVLPEVSLAVAVTNVV